MKGRIAVQQDDLAPDAGISLVELAITMVLTAIVVGLVASTFVAATRTTKLVSAKTNQTQDAKFALDTMSRRLRVADDVTSTIPAFASAGASAVTFYADLQNGSTADPNQSKVSYAYDSTRKCLLETVSKPTGTTAPYSYPASGQTTRCLAYGTISSSTQLFTYYASGTLVPLDGTGQVAAADLGTITSVTIDLTVTATNGVSGHGTSMQTSVQLTNQALSNKAVN